MSEISETYCALPSKQLALRHYENGLLKNAWPCCNMMIGGNVDFGIPDVHLLNPQEIFAHPQSDSLRQNLANGVRDPRCRVCWDMEDRGLKSYRQNSFNSSTKIAAVPKLTSVDLRVSNLCNLRCRMCDPKWSHSLMIDYRLMAQQDLLDDAADAIGFAWKPTSAAQNPAADDLHWQWIMDNTHEIKHIRASGGEPLYDKRMIELLRAYVATGAAAATTLHFHTNGTIMTDEILDLLACFKRNQHDFSVDGTGRTYEYIRHGSDWNLLNDNIRCYLSRVKPSVLSLVMTVNAMNVLDVGNYIAWAQSLGYPYRIHFQQTWPNDRGIALHHLPTDLLSLALSRLQHDLPDNPGIDANLALRLQQLVAGGTVPNRSKMLQEISIFDSTRQQHFSDHLDADLVSWLSSP